MHVAPQGREKGSKERREGFIRFSRCVVWSKLTRPGPFSIRVTARSIVYSSDFYVLFQFRVLYESFVPESHAVFVSVEIRRFPAKLMAGIPEGSIPCIHSFHGGPFDDVSPCVWVTVELLAVIRIINYFNSIAVAHYLDSPVLRRHRRPSWIVVYVFDMRMKQIKSGLTVLCTTPPSQARHTSYIFLSTQAT